MNDTGTAVRTFGNFSETRLLLDHAFSQYGQCQLLSADKVMAQFPVVNGENDLAVSARHSVSALMPKDMKADRVSFRCEESLGDISAPISKGSIVGIVELWYDGICVAQGDLIAMHDVKKTGEAATTLEPQVKIEKTSFGTVALVCLSVLLGIVALTALAAIVLRSIHVARHRKRRNHVRRRP
jgi:D-alanyl-D-alanine carboxypeptidase